MAIVEAASCGLQVVTTRVGGIPEVLPSSLTILTEPTIDSVYDGLVAAIERQLAKRQRSAAAIEPDSYPDLPKNGTSSKRRNRRNQTKNAHENHDTAAAGRILCPFECNDIVRNLYNWDNVARRTERVYANVLNQPDPPIGAKLRAYGRACGSYMIVVAAMLWILRLLDWLVPVRLIDEARDWSPEVTTTTTTATPKKRT